MSSEVLIQSVEEHQKHEQKAPQDERLRMYDAQVCIACGVVHPLPSGQGLQAFYCTKCHKRFQTMMVYWKKEGLYVKRSANESPASKG